MVVLFSNCKPALIVVFTIMLFFLWINMIVFLFSVFSSPQSNHVYKYASYSIKACYKTLAKFKAQSDAVLKAMTPSGLKYHNKKEKWIRDTESMPQQVQRNERDIPRSRYHLPFWSAGLHIENFSRVVKLLITSTAVCIFLILVPQTDEYTNLFIHGMIFFVLYFIIYLATSKTVLRTTKLAWWWHWSALSHIYAKGNLIVKTYHVLLLIYFGLTTTLSIFLFFIPFFLIVAPQSFLFLRVYNFCAWFFYTRLLAPFEAITRKYEKEIGFVCYWLYMPVETLVIWSYVWTKKSLYFLWVCMTPFLDERRRKNIRFYWTFF